MHTESTDRSRPPIRTADESRPGPHVLVVVGATGDLARRKLFPALFRLWQLKLLPERFRLICSSRAAPENEDAFLAMVQAAAQVYRGVIDDAAWEEFAGRISFVPTSEDDGAALGRAVSEAAKELDSDAQCLYYLAVPPSATESVVRMLGTIGVPAPVKIVLEKPFGRDLESARRLNATLHEFFEESQIYRIDHFLGKEAVQNILALRFANGLFQPVWNYQHVCYVQIDVPEEIDIQGRAEFMESTGTFRDMVSTHLFQLLEALRIPGERGWRLPDS